MSASERIQRFADDQAKLLVSGSKSAKIKVEIDKLRTWMQKHQNETVPDAAKGKLFQVLEKYNRAASYFIDIRDSVLNLFGDYLQMPEGKLVSARDKSKILIWQQALLAAEDNPTDSSLQQNKRTSFWSVESIDKRKKTITLLNQEDAELWKEDVQRIHSMRSLDQSMPISW
jgi:hypothetical protein